ncbi:hypothetical protein, partial [Nocardia sp. NPDC004722]
MARSAAEGRIRGGYLAGLPSATGRRCTGYAPRATRWPGRGLPAASGRLFTHYGELNDSARLATLIRRIE